MGKSLEEVFAGLTGQQIRAIVLKGWDTLGGRDSGEEGVRRLLAGELRLTIEEQIVQQPAPKPPLVGTLVKTLHLNRYKAQSIALAIRFGKYNGHDGDIIQLFESDDVALIEPVSVDLVRFDRDQYYDEILAWAKENGNKKPILPKHLFGIGIQHPEEQRNAPIVAFGSVQRGYALCLLGSSDWRSLRRSAVQSDWGRVCLFGFLSE